VKEEPRNRQAYSVVPSSSIPITIISLSAVHNSGVNNPPTKMKIICKITSDYYLATDSGDFLVFKNRCTLAYRWIKMVRLNKG
jgi:hypothetical protein